MNVKNFNRRGYRIFEDGGLYVRTTAPASGCRVVDGCSVVSCSEWESRS